MSFTSRQDIISLHVGNIEDTQLSRKPAEMKRKPLASRLDPCVVIPRVCGDPSQYKCVGKTFTRCYAPALGALGVPQAQFIAFIDALNVHKRGNKAFTYIAQAGSAVKLVGDFDPTGFTKRAGALVQPAGTAVFWGSVSGPTSRKVGYPKRVNETLFNPVGLTARIINSKELPNLLSLPPMPIFWIRCTLDPLSLPRTTEGRQAFRLHSCRRQILALSGRVSPVEQCGVHHKHAKETKDSKERVIWKWHVGSEIFMEEARGKALDKLHQVTTATTQKKKKNLS
ncbi:hypothetical protein J3459_014687 [Metarhizium acridum]|nr:hypothetical protein J3459_014687 [Metarhizium acridum]